MAQKRKIVIYPSQILETPSEEVTFPLSREDKQLIEDMFKTVEGIGVGLAAPQVGVNKRICIIHLEKDMQKKGKPSDYLLINPKIVFYSQVEHLMVEGCLSFPDEFYEIWRPANVVVEYQDIDGKKKKLRAKEWLSRVVQHEVDHLDGKIYTKLGGKKLTQDELEGKDVVD